MAKPKVFVSHVSEEAPLAATLTSHLSRDFLGLVEIFVSSDLESIAAGENWLTRLEQALREAITLIVLCSRVSLNRPRVNFEVGAAWSKSIPIVPVCHSRLRPRELPIPFSVLQGVEASTEVGLRRIYSLIADKLNCQLPQKDFAALVDEIKEFEKRYTPQIEKAFQAEIQRPTEARDRIYEAVSDPGYKWSSIQRERRKKNDSIGHGESMKSLFEDWETVQHRIRRAQTLFLLLGYDGTLTPIVDRPELALIPPEVKVLLERLRDCPKVLLAIISGRSLEDVRAKVGISGITYVGNHGLEIENPVGVHKKRLSPPREQELKRITRSLERSLRPVPGILLEDKGPILTVHYRNVPPKYRLQVRKAVEEVLGRWRNRWEAIPGRKILEVRPRVDFSKGRTVQQLLDGMPSAGVLPIYLGDDRFDEDAFRALPGRGISIFVGPRSTPVTADYSLRDPSEVREFLERCLGILGR